MPELPDIELYRSFFQELLVGNRLIAFKLFNPYVLRSVTPTIKDLEDCEVVGVRRLGKRIVLEFPGELFLIIHLMIAGRFRWMEGATTEARLGGKIAHAGLYFKNGALFLTEAGSKKRASLTIVKGEASLAAHDPGGIDVMTCSLVEFDQSLRSKPQTVKDALIDPHIFSGIGNAYSDEILHAAKISPLKRTKALTENEITTLRGMTVQVLSYWTEKLRREFNQKFPGAGDITAFRPDFAVHGKYGQPCPVCGKPVQRIRYADNETNYCATCQNGGKILADRAMSRLLKDDFPRAFSD